MTEQKDGEKKGARVRKIAVRVMGLALLVIAALYLLLNVVLNTPQATGRISRYLSDALHQPATVAGVNFAGGTLFIHSLTIANPPGFSGEKLLFARTITVTPAWSALLAGRKSFTSISIQGLKMSLAKNSAGAWNFSGLKELFGKKKSTSETFIKRLILESSAVSVNGRGITDISLSINDLSTKGSTGSGILLTFRDDFGAPYRVAGSAQFGAKPSLDLSLSAPSLSSKALRKFKFPLDPEKGKGKLLLTAGLHGDELKLGGAATFDRLNLLIKGEEIPLSGALDFAGRYDVKGDSATLDSCTLRVNGVIRLHARGRMERVKKERAFSAEVTHDGMEVKNLFALLPRKLRSDLLPGGMVLPGTMRIAGSGATGITSGSAALALRHGKFGKGERTLAEEVSVDAVLARGNAGWELHGRVSQPETTAGIPLRLQDIPFSALFSNHMSPLQADVPSFTTRINGIPVRGNVAYRSAAPLPVSARIDLAELPLAVLARSLPVKNLQVEKGSVTASLQVAGRVGGEFRGDVIARLTGLRGTYGGKKFALAEASTRAAFSGSGGKPTVMGRVTANGGDFAGKRLAASLAYRVADGRVTLSDGDCAVDRMTVRFTEISAAIPQKTVAGGGTRVPLRLSFNGIRCQRDDSGVEGLSGNLNALLISGAGARWLEGDGTVNAPGITYGNRVVASLAARMVLARGKGGVEITGKVLDGDLTASASADPFAIGEGGLFSINLSGMAGARMPQLPGKEQPLRLSGGMLDLRASGGFSGNKGVRCRMTIFGKDLALAGKNGRTILNNGGVKLDGEWEAGNLLLREGKVTINKEPEIALQGKLARAAAPDRAGEFTLALPRVSLGVLLDAFANILPRSLQEATAAGNFAADGKLRIKGKQTAVTGEMTLEGGSLDVPGQKLSIIAINGTIPISLDFSGKAAPKQPEKLSFSRENYPRLLQVMRQPVKEGHILTIGKISFGTTEFATTRLAIRAGNGLTEITSLESELFKGALLGHGFFRYQGGAQYGADILVHDLSLREVCNAYPAIKGYLSGRVDGFVSLFGKEKGLNDLQGFVELWARSDKNEKMLVSKDFLQKLAGKKLKGIFFQNDRPYDRGEIGAYLEEGYLTFKTLDISHTNFLGVRDLSVSVATVQNKIGLDHLLTTIREAAARGKAATGGAAPAETPAASEFKWEE